MFKNFSIILISCIAFSLIGCEGDTTIQQDQKQEKPISKKDKSENKDDDLDIIITPTGSIMVI